MQNAYRNYYRFQLPLLVNSITSVYNHCSIICCTYITAFKESPCRTNHIIQSGIQIIPSIYRYQNSCHVTLIKRSCVIILGVLVNKYHILRLTFREYFLSVIPAIIIDHKPRSIFIIFHELIYRLLISAIILYSTAIVKAYIAYVCNLLGFNIFSCCNDIIIEIFLRRFIAIRSDANLVGMMNFLINVPLFLIGYRVMSRRFCIKTMLSVAVQTLLLSVLPPLKAPLVEDVLLNSIFGAILCGVGVGYALRGSGCCGGMDIACMCLVKKYPDFKSGRLSIYVNAVLFSVCLFLFDLETTMYSIIFVAILYTVADRFHDQNINVAALIFTDVSTVQTEILQKMGRGVTFWNGYGAYTNHPKKILFCAVNKYEIGELQEIIHEQDPNAFVTFFVGPLIHGGFEKRL